MSIYRYTELICESEMRTLPFCAEDYFTLWSRSTSNVFIVLTLIAGSAALH